MKISKLRLRNYKGFGHDSEDISFLDNNGKPNDITVLVGENASGKSSILQAVAMLIGGAVRPKFRPSGLDWPGFGFDSLESGRLRIHVSCDLQFSEKEISATHQLAEAIKGRIPNYRAPGKSKEIKLHLNYGEDMVHSPGGPAALSQARGYQYALQQPAAARWNALQRVGKIFWYSEQRTSSSIVARAFDDEMSSVGISDKDLRDILGKWSNLHYRIKGSDALPNNDPFAELNRRFNEVFPGKRLVGAAPKRNPSQVLEDEDFWLRDDRSGMEYELANMSAGERSILPILIDFANWNIDNSIILIDEVELHLHPPLQQVLMDALPKLGKNNQFILTTHSPHVIAKLKPEQVKVVKDFKVMSLQKATKGRDVNAILTEVLGIAKRPPEYAEKLKSFYDLLENRSMEAAKDIFDALEQDWGMMDTEIVRARHFLEDLQDELAGERGAL
jgi:predicted ATPase